MAQPAKDNSSHYKKYQELFGIKCEILKVLHHGKARADQRPIYNAIGHIIELIAQDQKEQTEKNNRQVNVERLGPSQELGVGQAGPVNK